METQPILPAASEDDSGHETIIQDGILSTSRYYDSEHVAPADQELENIEGGGGKVITDTKVILVVAALTLTSFLVMLDMSILPTVGQKLFGPLVIT